MLDWHWIPEFVEVHAVNAEAVSLWRSPRKWLEMLGQV